MTEKKREGAFWNNWKGTAIPASGSTISNPNASGTKGPYGGWKGGTTGTQTSLAVDPFVADLFRMTPEEIYQVSSLLKSAGYVRNTTRRYNKSLGDAYSEASQEWSVESARTGRPNLTFREFLIENMMPDGTQERLPTRQVYNVTREQIDADVNNIAMNRLGRQLTNDDRQADWYRDLIKSVQKMYRAGVVSEPAKTVVNKKTGKKERVVEQTPQFSQKAVTSAITQALETADPVSLQRKKDLDFENWFLQNMRGQG